MPKTTINFFIKILSIASILLLTLLPAKIGYTANPISDYPKSNAVITAKFLNRSDFINAIYPIAQQQADLFGIDAKIIVAQAAHETGWGNRIPKHANGASSYNLFGLKHTGNSRHKKVSAKTKEYTNGTRVKTKAEFRAYNNFDESIADYIGLLHRSSRYSEVLQNKQDPQQFYVELQRAGYATDPRYANKIYDVYQTIDLT